MISIFGTYINIFELASLVVLLFLAPAIIAFGGIRVQLRNAKLFNIFIFSGFVYLTCILISFFAASNEARVFKGFLKWLQILGFAFLIFIYVRDTEKFKKVYWLFWTSNLSLLVIGIVDNIINKGFVFSSRVIPDYPSVITFCLLLPFARPENKSVIFLSMLFFLISFFSLTRGVWLVLLTYTVILLLRLNKRGKIVLFGTGTIAFTMLLLFTPVGDLVAWRLKGHKSNPERLAMAKVSLRAFTENPLTGIGTLNFPFYLATHQDESLTVRDKYMVLEPHNVFLQTAAEEGVFGVLSFSLMIITLFLIVFREGKPLVASTNFSPYLMGLKYLTVPITVILMFGSISDSSRLMFIVFFGLSLAILRLRPVEQRVEN